MPPRASSATSWSRTPSRRRAAARGDDVRVDALVRRVRHDLDRRRVELVERAGEVGRRLAHDVHQVGVTREEAAEPDLEVAVADVVRQHVVHGPGDGGTPLLDADEQLLEGGEPRGGLGRVLDHLRHGLGPVHVEDVVVQVAAVVPQHQRLGDPAHGRDPGTAGDAARCRAGPGRGSSRGSPGRSRSAAGAPARRRPAARGRRSARPRGPPRCARRAPAGAGRRRPVRRPVRRSCRAGRARRARPRRGRGGWPAAAGDRRRAPPTP